MCLSQKKSILTETLTVWLCLVAILHWSPKMLLACILLMIYPLRVNFYRMYITKNANFPGIKFMEIDDRKPVDQVISINKIS